MLRAKSARNSTIKNYHAIWKLFNKFVIKLDVKPKTWEQRLALYGAYLTDRGVQSATLKSYFSGIKKVLYIFNDGYELKMDNLLLTTLARACRLVNDTVKT